MSSNDIGRITLPNGRSLSRMAYGVWRLSEAQDCSVSANLARQVGADRAVLRFGQAPHAIGHAAQTAPVGQRDAADVVGTHLRTPVPSGVGGVWAGTRPYSWARDTVLSCGNTLVPKISHSCRWG